VFIGDGFVSAKTYDALEAGARRDAQRRLSALLAKAKKAGVRARSILLEGVAYDQIARIARSRRADLMVMGTHGRTGVSRFFMGSVAERVIPLARCPVLTVRGR
jgi:nucleotide-binding universal stress UspA family protein